MKEFKITHSITGSSFNFTEDKAPKWLHESWCDHVMKLEVGEKLRTLFNEVKRVK